MSLTVFLLVLVAAFLHAAWNAIVKGGDDKVLSTVMVAVIAGLLAATLLPALPLPAPASWKFIGASVLVHILYFSLVARIYQVADMSHAYPLMRGSAPLLVALASVIWLNDVLSATAWCGIAVISVGILSLALGPYRRGGAWGLLGLNILVIASYTLIDGTGVRLSGTAAGYTMWMFALTAVPLAGWALFARGAAFPAYVKRQWRLALLGGVGTVVSYGLVLWAMSVAPVAAVAALRESSILFATALSALVLSERVGRRRLVAAGIIVAGVAILRFS